MFQAFTDPKHVDHWWGPRGFKTEIADLDVRPGGTWHYVMRHEQYGKFKNRVVYRKVVRPERLECTHDSGVDGDPSAFEVTSRPRFKLPSPMPQGILPGVTPGSFE